MRQAWKSIRDLYSSRIQFRLTLFFLLILLPLVGVSLFANVKSTDILETQTGDRTKSSLMSVLGNVDIFLKDIDQLMLILSSDTSVKPVLQEAGDILLTEDLYNFYQVMKRMRDIASIQGSVEEIHVLHTSSGMLLSTEHGARKIDYRNEPWIYYLLDNEGNMTLYLPQGGAEPYFGTDTVSFMRLMDLPDLRNMPNVLVLTVERATLQKMIQGVKPSKNSSVYLYDAKGRLVTGTDQAYKHDLWMGLGAGEVGETNNNLLVWRVQSDLSGWSLVTIQPEHELYEESKELSLFTILIIVISAMLAVLISVGVYRWISTPLRDLLYGMKQMEQGKLHTRLEVQRNDEFGTLKNAFNQMIEEHQRLIQDVYEHQLRLSKTEMKFLQSQINPHFLYNTLDSIYWTAKNYEADEISEMVLNLSKFFRLSLSKGQEAFTVEETIEHLKYYLRVQELRFLDQFTVTFDIAEETKHYYLLKLLLQPVVENAILHGLEKRGYGGELLIKSRMDNGLLRLEVKDNGAGIPEDKLAYIRREIGKLDHVEQMPAVFDDRNHQLFGLRNVVGRMKLYYGAKAKLTIVSIAGEGTTVTLFIPVEQPRKNEERTA